MFVTGTTRTQKKINQINLTIGGDTIIWTGLASATHNPMVGQQPT